MSKCNLFDLDEQGIANFCQAQGEPSYRATQLLQWIHQYGVIDFSCMSNISKKFQQQLQQVAEIVLPEVINQQQSKDGTVKWLLKLNCGNCIEMVFIPESNRGTLCVSSQVGCALNCSFCATGKQGFNRNLSTGEIVAQVWLAVRALSKEDGKHDRAITNIVLMGMGEPLLNLDNVIPALSIMMNDYAYGFSKYRVTVSTSGLVPAMQQLRQQTDAALAVSLHAANDKLRNILVPINKKYPLEQLRRVCREYFSNEPRRKITFEYVMLRDVNDSLNDAKELVKLLQGIPCKVNLIPFNAVVGINYQCSTPEQIELFRQILQKAGVNNTVRKPRGPDIDAACGQLAGKVDDRTQRTRQWQKEKQPLEC